VGCRGVCVWMVRCVCVCVCSVDCEVERHQVDEQVCVWVVEVCVCGVDCEGGVRSVLCV